MLHVAHQTCLLDGKFPDFGNRGLSYRFSMALIWPLILGGCSLGIKLPDIEPKSSPKFVRFNDQVLDLARHLKGCDYTIPSQLKENTFGTRNLSPPDFDSFMVYQQDGKEFLVLPFFYKDQKPFPLFGKPTFLGYSTSGSITCSSPGKLSSAYDGLIVAVGAKHDD